MKRQQWTGPRFLRFLSPLLEALRKLGGAGAPEDVKRQIIKDEGIKLAELAEKLASGNGRVSNEINWARFYLARAGYVDSSKRGSWALTDRGRSANLSLEEARSLFKRVHRKYGGKLRAKRNAAKSAKATPTKGKVKAMPRSVARRIMARCARGEKKIVVINKNGKPSSVFGFDEYLKMQELPRQVKPWTGRKTQPKPSDELPSIDAGIMGPLDRKDFYE